VVESGVATSALSPWLCDGVLVILVLHTS